MYFCAPGFLRERAALITHILPCFFAYSPPVGGLPSISSSSNQAVCRDIKKISYFHHGINGRAAFSPLVFADDVPREAAALPKRFRRHAVALPQPPQLRREAWRWRRVSFSAVLSAHVLHPPSLSGSAPLQSEIWRYLAQQFSQRQSWQMQSFRVHTSFLSVRGCVSGFRFMLIAPFVLKCYSFTRF